MCIRDSSYSGGDDCGHDLWRRTAIDSLYQEMTVADAASLATNPQLIYDDYRLGRVTITMHNS